jgi:hypothetical protein
MNRNSEFTVFYICEPGRLEWQSLCLASSIMTLCTDDYRLVSYCSRAKIQNLREETTKFHRRHNIPIIPLDTEGVFPRRYDIGSKIVAACQARSGQYAILMDTDTMLVSNTDFSNLERHGAILAFPSHTRQLGYSAENWRELYGKFGLQLPRLRFRLDFGDEAELGIPYFNAGLIIFPERLPNVSFGANWLEVTKVVQNGDHVIAQSPWVDQVALPVSISMTGLMMRPLDRTYNFPVEEEGKLIRPDVKIIHYHHGKNLHHCSAAGFIECILRETTQFQRLEDMFSAYDQIGYHGRA